MPPFFSSHSAFYDLATKGLDGIAVAAPSWLLVFITVCAAAVGAGGAFLLFRIPPNLRRYDPASYEERWRGFRGMLILLGLTVGLEFVRLMLQAGGLPFFYSDALYQQSTTTEGTLYHPLFSTVLAINAAAVGLRLGIIPVLAIAFIRRRRSARWLGISYMVLLLLLLGANDVLLSQIFERGHQIILENFLALTHTAQASIIITPYLFLSRRFNATFSE